MMEIKTFNYEYKHNFLLNNIFFLSFLRSNKPWNSDGVKPLIRTATEIYLSTKQKDVINVTYSSRKLEDVIK